MEFTKMKTGEKCQTSGVYKGDCIPKSHKQEIALSKGETFPPCNACHHAVNWALVRAMH